MIHGKGTNCAAPQKNEPYSFFPCGSLHLTASLVRTTLAYASRNPPQTSHRVLRNHQWLTKKAYATFLPFSLNFACDLSCVEVALPFFQVSVRRDFYPTAQFTRGVRLSSRDDNEGPRLSVADESTRTGPISDNNRSWRDRCGQGHVRSRTRRSGNGVHDRFCAR